MSERDETSKNALYVTTLGALGVVFGDIGTSPIYALRECFSEHTKMLVTEANVFGVLSLVFWSFVFVVSIKYIFIMMRADNKGEGGNLSLLALVHPSSHKSFESKFIIALGLAGASLLFGDGIITPAISVLSAVEGLTVASPVFEPMILPITIGILIGLFMVQKKGTTSLGKVFGWVVLLWFLVLGVLGASHLMDYPGIGMALLPTHAIEFLLREKSTGFVVLSGVFLAITGCEALYADMGHFGKSPIRLGWFAVVFPCLTLNYFGQGALLLKDPSKISDLFFSMAPSSMVIPLVVLSTLATIIASQAVITGVFSLISQAVQLGYFPRINIQHTSEDKMGQIYISFVNRILAVSTIWLVLTFRSSSNLASAYGIAVSMTMLFSTGLIYFVMRDVWEWGAVRRWAVCLFFLGIDCTFFSSNILKVASGGWFPISVGILGFLIMTTWYKGRGLVAARMSGGLLPVESFVKELRDCAIARVPGTAVFLSSNVSGVPPSMTHLVNHTKAIHEQVILMAIKIEEEPYVEDYDRVQVEGLGEGFYRTIAHIGFMERPNVPELLRLAVENVSDLDLRDLSYFVGRESVFATARPGMAIWREELFAFMSRNAERAAGFLRLPRDKVVEIGIQVEI